MPRKPPSPHDALRRAAVQGIRALFADLRSSARAVETRTGLTNAQLYVLQLLAGASQTLSVGQVATIALSSPAAVSTIVARLARKGLVSRRTPSHDARRVELALTPAGRAILRRAPAPATARLVEAVSTLPPAKLRTLVGCITALTDQLGIDIHSPSVLFEDRRILPVRRAKR
jgi:DNA-binding MarR family transcriptional regulator